MSTNIQKALDKMIDIVPTIDGGEMDEMQLKRKRVMNDKAKNAVKSGMIWKEEPLSVDGKEQII